MVLFNSVYGGNIWEVVMVLGILFDQLLDFSVNINLLGMFVSVKCVFIDNLDCIECYLDVDYFYLYQVLVCYYQVLVLWILVGNGEMELIFIVVSGFKLCCVMIVMSGFVEYGWVLV